MVEMLRIKALVIELEDNFYDVGIDMGDDPIFYMVGGAIDAEMALRSALERRYGDCDYTCTCCSKDGVHCIYDVEVIDDEPVYE